MHDWLPKIRHEIFFEKDALSSVRMRVIPFVTVMMRIGTRSEALFLTPFKFDSLIMTYGCDREDRVTKNKTSLGSAILLLGAALLSILVGTGSARAMTISPDGNSVSIGASDIGASFKVDWSKFIGSSLPQLTATSVWTILGIGAHTLTLQIALTNSTADTTTFHTAITTFGAGVTPNATGAFAPGGSGTVFKNVSSGNGPQQTFPGGFKGIDLCVSSAGCSGGSFQNGLHASVTDVMTVLLTAAFGSDPTATLAFFPIKFQTSGSSYEIAGTVGVVPLPATLPLLAAGIGWLGILGRRRRITSAPNA